MTGTDDKMPQGQGRPDPDPTILTTQALMREIEAVKELLKDQDVNHKQMLKDKVDARHTEQLALMDLLQSKIDSLNAVTNEKFESTDREFALVERQRIELKNDTKGAVDAALIAQKEAVKEQTIASDKSIAKTETNTDKRLEEQAKTTASDIGALRTVVSDLKDQVIELRAEKRGGQEQITERRQANSSTIGVIAAISTVLGIMLTLAATGIFSR